MPQDNFEDILRKKLTDHELKAPDGLWEDIEAAMQAGQRRRHIRILRLATIGIAAAACLFVAFPWMTPGGTGGGGRKQMRQMMAEEKAAHGTVRDIVADNTPARNSAEDRRDDAPGNRHSHSRNAGTDTHDIAAAAVCQPMPSSSQPTPSSNRDNGDTIATTPEPAKTAACNSKTSPQNTRATATRNAVATVSQHDTQQRATPVRHRRNTAPAPLTASVYGFGVGGGSSSPAGNVQMSDMKATYWDNTAYVADPQQLSQKPEITADHHYPIRFGAAMRYQIAPRIGLESGVRYTILNSDFTSKNANINISQNVGFLGIPVTVTYDILQAGAFSTYATAGGEVAKSIVAHDDNGSSLPHPWQLSVQAAVGMQYGITENIGVYIEPGIGYYFDNNSSLETYYSEHPINFTLSFGFRLLLK
ncbi:MAG: outer membrane beta-barrel protein [Bacteroidales bacterium]|nr:outer membrane beta-barrel protein [Bacteroidales bacterium]